jgi:hypothetical protein
MELGIHQCEIVITDNRQETRIPVTVNVTAANATDEVEISEVVVLMGNYPNPFNPETDIRFLMQEAGDVDITIYNVRGQVVKTLSSMGLTAGEHSINWQGKDQSGRPVSSGVYFYEFSTSDYTTTKKMVLMK